MAPTHIPLDVPPRDRTPKATHRPASKLLCSKAFEPESPSHVPSPETNSLAVTSEASDGRQSWNVLSFEMQVSGMSCLMRRIPAVVPVVSVGELTPYPMAVTVVA